MLLYESAKQGTTPWHSKSILLPNMLIMYMPMLIESIDCFCWNSCLETIKNQKKRLTTYNQVLFKLLWRRKGTTHKLQIYSLARVNNWPDCQNWLVCHLSVNYATPISFERHWSEDLFCIFALFIFKKLKKGT